VIAAVRLAEWQTVSPTPGSPTEGLDLGPDPGVRDLARRLAEARVLEVLELRSGLSVRSTSYVGRVRLGEVEITVVPKLPGESLLTLLRYAYGLRDLHLLPSTAHGNSPLGFQDILVWQLVEEARELLARGLKQDYIRRHEALASPRGRVDFRALAGRGAQVEATLPCVHHRRDRDRLVNRVLLAGLRLAASLAGDRALGLRAWRLAALLQEAAAPIRLDRQVFRRLAGEMDRTTRPYEAAVTLTRILHEGEGLSLDDEPAGPGLPGFVFDMNRFFQALVGRFLSDNLPDHTIRPEHRLAGMFAYVPGWNPRRRQAPTPRPDFLVSAAGGGAVAILDAKYRDLWENPLPREMLYQLAIYATSHEGGSATILYPTTHVDATEARVEMRDPLHGAKRATVRLRPIDLGTLERLVTARPTPSIIRERRAYASSLAL
jgi:5-methylcytosine-specific restriction enzyme subunit McrC